MVIWEVFPVRVVPGDDWAAAWAAKLEEDAWVRARVDVLALVLPAYEREGCGVACSFALTVRRASGGAASDGMASMCLNGDGGLHVQE